MPSNSISVRGVTYTRLKARADFLGIQVSELVQTWIEEYQPFGKKRPRPLLSNTSRVSKQKPHPKSEPNTKDEAASSKPEKRKPYVTNPPDPTLKPPPPRSPRDGGVILL